MLKPSRVAGDQMGQIVLRTLRAEFFPASIMPVALGSILAYKSSGRVDWGLLTATVLGVVGLHGAGNVANDYFDHKSGNDDINQTFIRPFTGGSRTVQQGLITPRGLAALSLGCLGLGLLAAVYLAIQTGLAVLLLGGAGVLLAYAYSAPPFRLSARGWGEIVIGLNFGVLPVWGSYFVQTGEWSRIPVLWSLPLMVLIVAVLVVNQFPDFTADETVDKRNWVVRLGRDRGAVLYALLMCAWPAMLVLAVWPGGAPKVILLALVGLLPAGMAVWTVFKYRCRPDKLAPACALTGFLHAGVGLVLCVSLLLS